MSHKNEKPNGRTSAFGLNPFEDPNQTGPAPAAEMGWRRLGFSQFHPSVDPNSPPAYLLEVQGQRTDGNVFTVKLALDKRKVDLIPSPEIALKVCRDEILRGLSMLDQFRLCACTADTSCKQHQRQ